MPTGASNDLVPVRKPTKRRLAALKGADSYDAVVNAALDLVPPDALRARLDLARAAADAPPRERSPSKQALIARLAAERQRLWRAEGRIVPLAPRRWRYVPPPSDAEVTRVVRRPGRGRAP